MARRYVFDDDLPDDPAPAPAAQPVGGSVAALGAVLKDAYQPFIADFLNGRPPVEATSSKGEALTYERIRDGIDRIAAAAEQRSYGENVLGPVYSKAQRDFMEAMEPVNRYRATTLPASRPAPVPRQPDPAPVIVPGDRYQSIVDAARAQVEAAKQAYMQALRCSRPPGEIDAARQGLLFAREQAARAERETLLVEPPGIDLDQPPGAVRTMLEQLRDAQNKLASDRAELARRARPSEYYRVRTSNNTSDV